MNSRVKLRARIILIGILLVAIVLCVWLYSIQIVRGDSYAKKANQQYIKPATALLDRGSIFFTAKDGTKIQAATLKSGFKIFMNPSLVLDPKPAYEALSEYLTLDKEDFMRKVIKSNDHYEELADRVAESTATSIRNLGVAGLGVSKETWRVYPGGSMVAHELGLLGESASSTSVTGRYGLERSYENVLKRSGTSSNANAFAQLFISIRDALSNGNEEEGDIVTTIEPTTQKYLEKILGETSLAWRPDSIGGIVIDPKTGEVVAMSSLPTFDPNDTSSVKNVRVFSNPLVENVYEMGSIMKPLTMAVALDTGAETVNSTYDDTGTMTLSGKKISNFDGKARGVVSMQEILSQSLNVGVATIALKVGKEDFSKYFLNFGLGNKTGIDLPNEATGIVGNLKTGRDVEIATAAYGQGLAISPINMVTALSVLANGGYVVKPHLVKEISHADGTVKKIDDVRKGPFLKTETTNDVTKMLVEVVDKSLLKGAIKIDRYSIAAKTGTAQIPDHVNGGYYTDRYLHSFFGYLPASNPKYLIFLYQVYPKGAEYASATLTNPFDQMAKFLIDYYNIAPDR
ncbi:MAG: penicillin-binding protein 2 [Candidatus Paceibacterota bacterium]